MVDTTTPTTQQAAPVAAPAAVVVPPVAEAPVSIVAPAQNQPPQEQPDAPSYRFSEEQLKSVDSSSPEEVKRFIGTLTTEERKRVIEGGGLKALLPPSAPQKTDPTPAVADPADAATDPSAPQPNGSEPLAGGQEDAPAWELTEEDLASASPKTLALYKEFLDLQEKVEGLKPPEPDPIFQDPRIRYLESAIRTGNLDLPQVTIDDLVQLEGGKFEDLFAAVDEAHVAQDPNLWRAKMSNLARAVATETLARARVSFEGHIAEAHEEGAKAVEFKYGLKDFLGGVPEYKAAGTIFTPEGKINPSHPAAEFVTFISENGNKFSDYFASEGVENGLHLAWTAFQSKKAGGYNKMIANIRGQESVGVAKRARATLEGFLAKRTAPSVGTVQVPANGGNNQALYHGFDLRTIHSKEQVAHVYNSLRNAGNHQAAAGLAEALMASRG